MIKRIRKAISRLRNAYKKGLISYPRVDNKYSPKKEMFYPHPAINEFDAYAMPLQERQYPYKKETFPLALANEGIATASTLEGIMVVVDKYYDEHMKPISEREMDLKEKITQFKSQLNTLGIKTEPYHIDYGDLLPDGNIANMPMELIRFKFDLEPSSERKKKSDEVKPAKRRDHLDNYIKVDVSPTVAKNFHEAMEEFKLREIRNIMEDVAIEPSLDLGMQQ